jgi:Flp pilus assembly pilin Flp
VGMAGVPTMYLDPYVWYRLRLRPMHRMSSMTVFGLTKEKSTMTNFLRNLWTDDRGQDLIEYTLLMAFVALGSAALFISAGTSVSSIWSTTNAQLSAAASAAAG